MADITFKRLGTTNANGSVPGLLTIGTKNWPTIERGISHTFVRKGDYKLLMTEKVSGRKVKCLCFYEDRAISTHLIHDAKDNSHKQLSGCIAPGLTSDATGISGSAAAMEEVFTALGGYKQWAKRTITVENNIHGTETKDAWIKRRKKAREAASEPTR